MAWKKRIGKTLESCSSAGGNKNRDAGVAYKNYFCRIIKTYRSIKEIHLSVSRTVFEKSTAKQEPWMVP
jgi:hypothetical protein